MYVLVLFTEGPQPEDPEVVRSHEDFIDELIGRNQILLGGSFRPRLDAVRAAYVLRVDSLDQARAITAEDPYFKHGCYRPQLVHWDLVGINLRAIDPELAMQADEA